MDAAQTRDTQTTRDALAYVMRRLDVAGKEIAETFAFFDVVKPFLRNAASDGVLEGIVDVGGGQGLTALCWLCLTDMPNATIVDQCMPPSHVKTVRAMRKMLSFATPDYFVGKLAEFGQVASGRLAFVGVHCCGGLADELIATAIERSAPFAVMTCCHPFRDPLLVAAEQWLAADADQSHLMDLMRLDRARERGYSVELATIDRSITPKNRILLGKPRGVSGKKCGPRTPERGTLAWEELSTHRSRKHHLNRLLKRAGLGELERYEELAREPSIEVTVTMPDGVALLVLLAPMGVKRFDAVEAFEGCDAAEGALAIDGSGKLIRNVYMLTRQAPQ